MFIYMTFSSFTVDVVDYFSLKIACKFTIFFFFQKGLLYFKPLNTEQLNFFVSCSPNVFSLLVLIFLLSFEIILFTEQYIKSNPSEMINN
uniref:Uncharacterized protein n=1 Tax=Anguilla anguilla TaxID=7936 RepID=A0A0E9X008_ANGAN